MIDNLNEETIKNKLIYEAIDEGPFNSMQFINYYSKSQFILSMANPFQEVSDWTNRYRINQGRKGAIKTQIKCYGDERKPSENQILRSKVYRKHHSSCEGGPKKQRFQVSPINVKFHTQTGNIRLKKLTNKQPQKLKEPNLSIYDTNYKPLSLLYQQKLKQSPKIKQYQDIKANPFNNSKKLPKTEMVSSIMRMMKRNQQIRSYRQKHSNPQTRETFIQNTQ